MNEVTLCQSCDGEAIARVHNEWLCARCGLQRTTATATIGTAPKSGVAGNWRGAVRTALGSGLIAKVLIGAAAVAAVGSAVGSDAPPDTVPPETTPPVSTPVGPPGDPAPAADPAHDASSPGVVPAGGDTGEGAPTPIATYIAAVNDWSACIDAAVHEFAAARTGGGFDPFAACPDKPSPAAYGVASSSRPEWAGRPDDPGAQAAGGKPESPGTAGSGR